MVTDDNKAVVVCHDNMVLHHYQFWWGSVFTAVCLFVCLSVCLSVSLSVIRITQKVVAGFP